jgi:hypothetical protein
MFCEALPSDGRSRVPIIPELRLERRRIPARIGHRARAESLSSPGSQPILSPTSLVKSGNIAGGPMCSRESSKLRRASHSRSVSNLESRTVLRPRAAVIVDARGGDVGVSKPFLHLGDISLVVERIGGRHRAQRMSADRKSEFGRISAHQLILPATSSPGHLFRSREGETDGDGNACEGQNSANQKDRAEPGCSSNKS